MFFAIFIPFYGVTLVLSHFILGYLPEPTLYTGSVGWDLVIWGLVLFPVVGFLTGDLVLTINNMKAVKIVSPNLYGTTAGQRKSQFEHGTEVHTNATMRLEELELASGFTDESVELWHQWRELYLQLSKNMFTLMGFSPKEITRERNERILLEIDNQANELTALGKRLDKLNNAYWRKQRKEQASKKTSRNTSKDTPEQAADLATEGALQEALEAAAEVATQEAVAQDQIETPERIKVEAETKKTFKTPIEVKAIARRIPALKTGKRLLAKATSPVEGKIQLIAKIIAIVVFLLVMVAATWLAPSLAAGITIQQPFWFNYFFVCFQITFVIAGMAWFLGFFDSFHNWIESKIYSRQPYKNEEFARIMTAMTVSLPMLGLEVETAAQQYPEYAKTIRARYKAFTTHVDQAQKVTGFANDRPQVDSQTAFALARFLRLEANSLWRVRDLINGEKRAWAEEISWWQHITNRDVEITATLTDSDQALATLQELDEATKPANRARALRGLSQGVKLLPSYARDRQKEGRWAQQEAIEGLVAESDLINLDEVYSALILSEKNYNKIFRHKKVKTQEEGFFVFIGLMFLVVYGEIYITPIGLASSIFGLWYNLH